MMLRRRSFVHAAAALLASPAIAANESRVSYVSCRQPTWLRLTPFGPLIIRHFIMVV